MASRIAKSRKCERSDDDGGSYQPPRLYLRQQQAHDDDDTTTRRELLALAVFSHEESPAELTMSRGINARA